MKDTTNVSYLIEATNGERQTEGDIEKKMREKRRNFTNISLIKDFC